MHYLTAENLSKSYGVEALFSGLNFHINQGNKIAIVARNGFGKSTLLRIIAGHETPDTGSVWVHKEVKVVLFEQEPVFDEYSSIAANIFNHDHPVLNAVRHYESLGEQAGEQELQDAIARMDELGGWDVDARVKQICGKLNISDLTQTMISLSGGQRKRVALAKTLLDISYEKQHPLLLMDEPTNHLDVGMVEWLEQYLNQQKITLLMVTHDRYFLDAVCNEIWEIDDSGLYTYQGDYEYFLEQKAARIENTLASIDKAKNEFRKELEWMRRQPKARTTKAKSRIQAFDDVEFRAKQRVTDDQLQLQTKMSRLGGKVAEFKKVYKSYGDRKILSGFDYTFTKGERIGIVGKNGAGKSTFLKLLEGLEAADSGKINIGDTVVFGHYTQESLSWDKDMRVIEYVKQFAETFPLDGGGALTAAKFLELFLFTGDKQYTYLSKLSGGEKRRLQLLTILFRNPNFLILDEPTNDLDLPTLGVLENFLQGFAGCLLVVSHDRYFMDKLVDHLFVFEGDGVVRDFPGNYSHYRLAQETEKEKAAETAAPPKPKAATTEAAKPKTKLSYNEKRELEQLEKDMAALGEERSRLTELLNSGTLEYTALEQSANRIATINEELDEKEMRWLELSELA